MPIKVNHEVWRACSAETREPDLKMKAVPKSLVASLVSLNLLSNKLLQLSPITGESNLSELINLASDSMALISSANRELNMKRRETIKPTLQPDYKPLCSTQVSITSKLFGENLQSDMVKIKNTLRFTKSLSPSYRPQTPQISGANLKHKININTKQGKPF